MKLSELSPAEGSVRSAYRKGRGAGSGNGKTGGRGHKGQKARSGGKVRIVEINHVKVDFTGEYSAIIVIHQDTPGVVAYITRCLSERNINIAFMRLFRESKGTTAYTIVESDGHLPEDIVESIHQNTNIHDVMVVQM